MKTVLFIFLTLIVWHVDAQAPHKTAAPAVAKSSVATATASTSSAATTKSNNGISIEEEAQRILYAKELMNVMNFDQAIKQSVDGAEAAFKNAQTGDEKNEEAAKKALTASQEKFDALKGKFPQQIHDHLLKELTVRYNSIELKYLIEINSYSLNKNFKAFIESEDYLNIMGKPLNEAHNIMKEAKRKIASEPVVRPVGRTSGKGK